MDKKTAATIAAIILAASLWATPARADIQYAYTYGPAGVPLVRPVVSLERASAPPCPSVAQAGPLDGLARLTAALLAPVGNTLDALLAPRKTAAAAGPRRIQPAGAEAQPQP